jgi:hypothetical protein
MPATSQSPEKQLDSFLAKYTPAIAAQARDVRARLEKRMPTAVQMIYDNYNGLVIGFSPSDRPLDAALSMIVLPDHVTVCFLRGATLPDPDGLLEGSGNQVRHIKLTKPADLAKRDVSKMITAALTASKVPYRKTREKRVEVRAVMVKQRPRRPRVEG